MHRSFFKAFSLFTILCLARGQDLGQVAMNSESMTAMDRFDIFSQMNLHQAYIDKAGTCENAHLYASLYWPDATFRVYDAKSGRNSSFSGLKEIRSIFDYAHSVFPLYQWQHSAGQFEIYPGNSSGDTITANASWKWRVDWKANTTGVVSTGRYTDVFEKRDGVWKCLRRSSTDDPNWRIEIFWPYIVNEKNTFVNSCDD